ncbi:MAG TPA: PH domain-containing protein [Stellaceae bacterium]|nr:PH domain-containing protein [Stellaceae bacterium]
MSYVTRVLQPGERLLHESRLHWAIYLPGFFFILIAVVGFALSNSQPPLVWEGLVAIGILCALLAWLKAWLRRMGTELAVTDRRVIYKQGLIRRHTVEMNMDKVESVDVDQSILGRIFNYGDVTIRGTGASLEPLQMIEDPLAFRSHVTAR